MQLGFLLKVDMCHIEIGGHPNFNTRIIWTPIFEWHVLRIGSKNKHQNDMCLKEIGLHAQNTLTILSSKVKIIGLIND